MKGVETTEVGEEVMELGTKRPGWGHTGEARRQDKADRGSLGQRYSSAQIFYLCLSFSFFWWGKGDRLEGRQKNKIKERKKNMTVPPTPSHGPWPQARVNEGEDEHTHSGRTAIT